MSESRELAVGGQLIAYTVNRSRRRRKTIELKVDAKRGVLVSAPLRASTDFIEDFVRSRAGWISTHARRPRTLISGASLPFLGRAHKLFVQHALVTQVEVFRDGKRLVVAVPLGLEAEEVAELLESGLLRWYRWQAERILTCRVSQLGKVTGLKPKGIHVRDQKERWGSCSSSGVIRLNWRLAMMDQELIDYVAVHELVHLRVGNHGPLFWAEVERWAPRHKALRARLREVGRSLPL